MKKLIAKIRSYRDIYKAKRHIKKMFKAFEYFDDKLCQHYHKPYFYSHFLGMFPTCASMALFMDNICGSLQFIKEYMETTRSDWANIVECVKGNIIFEGKKVKFYIDTQNDDDFDHDIYFIIDNITSIVDPDVCIKYGEQEYHGLCNCIVKEFESTAFKYIGIMISDVLASIYVEHRSRREERKK